MATFDVPSLDDIRAVVRDEIARALLGAASASAPLLSVADAATALGVHPRTVRRRISAGELPVVRVGRIVRIDRAVLRPDAGSVAVLAREALARVA